MKKSFLILLSTMILMAILPFNTLAQVTDEKSETYILSNKQAQSQTKAMVMLLDLKEPAIKAVGDINLKYQLMVNNLRASTTITEEKKEMHAWINQQKNAELKSALTEEQYNKYIQSLDNAKAQLNDRLSKRQ